MISHSRFIEILSHHISNSDDFLDDLLKTVITNPNRYCGIFRLSDAKTKLIQNVTQSKEIKFGDFMEDIITEYLGLAGYQNMPKNIGKNKERDELNVDQLFVLGKTLFLIEQKCIIVKICKGKLTGITMNKLNSVFKQHRIIYLFLNKDIISPDIQDKCCD